MVQLYDELFYFRFQVSVAHSLFMAVLHSWEKLLEEKRGGLLSSTAVNLNAIKQLSSVG